MLIVTGANGQLGRMIVNHLLARVPADQIGVSVREPEKARTLLLQGVRVREGDFTDPEHLAYAFEGASQVLLISLNSVGEAAVQQLRTAIAMAIQAGARRILYTSHMGASRTSPFAPMIDHAATEATLRESGVAFTSLRNGFYATTVSWLLGNVVETGELALPEDGPVSWTTHADLAEGAAIAMTEDRLDGVSRSLTASEAIDMDGVAAIVSELVGRPIRRVVISDDDYRDRLIALGLPEAAVSMQLGIFRASRQGAFAEVDPTLAQLIGHAPIPLRDVLTQAIASAH